MKNFILVLCVLCMGLVFAEPIDVHISIVPKNISDDYLAMMANDNYQIIATKEPVDYAIRSITVSVKDEETLFFVEAFTNMIPELEGEIARLENVIVVVLPIPAIGHSHYPGKPELFMKEVPLHGETERIISGLRSDVEFSSLFHLSDVEVNIDKSYLETKLKELTGVIPVTVNGDTFTVGERRSDSGRQKARLYLAQEFRNLGFEVKEHSYNSGWYQGANLVAEKKGSDASKYFIISAHYDTVSTVGADDDGTGVIGILAIANALKNTPLNYSLRVVCFDQEELGLVGSKAYAASLNNSGELNNMLGLIQLEMLGYDRDNDGGYHVIDCNENTSPQISDMVVKTVLAAKINLSLVPACTNRSDHASFWPYRKPAIVISQNFFGGDSNPCYHRGCDSISNIDFNYMQKIVSAVTKTLLNTIAK